MAVSKIGLVGILVLCGLQAPAWAVDDVPFAITGVKEGTISCRGPGISDIVPRLSGCHRFDAQKRLLFYRADINIFSPFGPWRCSIFTNCGESDIPESPKAEAGFCLSNDRVELKWDGGGSLTADQPLICTSTLTRSILGQTGEADDTPAQDVDSFTFAGKAGERVELVLDRDGSAGSAGEIATLRVRGGSGGVIGERTGPVPIRLELRLPGRVEITVARNGAKPGGNAFRGYYQLKVAPVSGELGGRLLVPAVDVEQ
ncbi:MAG: hypothetical protein AB7I59_00160 [Geminicoccaceae bacterium]